MKIFRIMLVVSLVMIAACSALPNHKDDFAKKNDDFMLRVRWLDFAGAALHFEGETRQEFIERFDDVDDLKVTAFSMARLDLDVPQEKVTAHYRLEYYILPSATVQKKRFSLIWEQQPVEASGQTSDKVFWRITQAFPELL